MAVQPVGPGQNPSEAEAQFWRTKRDAFLDSISDRVRTMSLGALVVVWGLFTGKEQNAFHFGVRSEIALLCVAIGAVLVVILDLIEYSMGYQAARQGIPGEKVRPYKFNYDVWKTNSLHAKQFIGCATLLALVVILGAILVTSVAHAQKAAVADVYKGH
ncbi:MAG: hypothetical protein ABR881_28060 [Candidatus Sulfotelmatobacter sp.]|jgi:hypothetical protein